MASTTPLERLPDGKPKPGTKWRTFVRLKGYRSISETHDSHKEGVEWGKRTEAEMLLGTSVDFRSLRENTVGDVLRWHSREISALRKPAQRRWEENVIERLLQEPWAALTLDRMPEVEQALRLYSADRQTGKGYKRRVKGQTINRELNLISSAFTKVRKAAGFVTANPVRGIQRPETRDVVPYKVWSPEDLQLWLDDFKFDPNAAPKTLDQFLPWALLLLNTTGLRPVNLFDTPLEDVDIEGQVIHYPSTKNGDAYDCPLDDLALPIAAKLVEHMQARRQSKLLPVNYGSLAVRYRVHRERLAKTTPRLKTLCIYGQRHTWTTTNVKFFENMVELMVYTGRKSIKTLLPYFRPTPKTQAQTLAERRRAHAEGRWQAPERTEHTFKS